MDRIGNRSRAVSAGRCIADEMDSGFSCRSLVNKAINIDYRHPNDPTLQGSSYVSFRAPCLGNGTLHFSLCTNIMAHGRWPIVRRPAYTCIAYISFLGLAADSNLQVFVIIHYLWSISSYVLVDSMNIQQ